MLPPEFEPIVPPNERPQRHALDRAAIGIGWDVFQCGKYLTKYKETFFVIPWNVMSLP